jgi:hypothetical protein
MDWAYTRWPKEHTTTRARGSHRSCHTAVNLDHEIPINMRTAVRASCAGVMSSCALRLLPAESRRSVSFGFRWHLNHGCRGRRSTRTTPPARPGSRAMRLPSATSGAAPAAASYGVAGQRCREDRVSEDWNSREVGEFYGRARPLEVEFNLDTVNVGRGIQCFYFYFFIT